MKPPFKAFRVTTYSRSAAAFDVVTVLAIDKKIGKAQVEETSGLVYWVSFDLLISDKNVAGKKLLSLLG